MCRALGQTLALAICCSAHAGEALVTNQTGDSVSIVDLSDLRQIAEIRTGGKPAGIAMSGDRALAYVSAPEGREIIEIDAARRTIKRRLTLGEGPLGIAAHPSRAEIYVADWYAHKIFVVETEGLTAVAEIAVGQSPSGLDVTPDGTLLLSADRDSNAVSIIDLASRTVVATVPVGERPFGLTIEPDGRRAFTANVASNDVSVIDLDQRIAVATIAVGRRPYAVAFAGPNGFVTDQYGGTVTVFARDTLEPIRTIEACDHPEGIEAGRDGASLYVACWGDDKLIRIDAVRLTVSGETPVGSGPRAFGRFLR